MRGNRLRWLFILTSIGLALLIARLAWPYFGWIAFGAKTGMMNYDDFVLSGTVVDQSAAPLDVRVKIEKSWKRKMGFESETKSTYETITGSFRFTLNNCDSVHLLFLKEGYQMEELSFKTEGKYQNIRVVMKPEPRTVSSTTQATR